MTRSNKTTACEHLPGQFVSKHITAQSVPAEEPARSRIDDVRVLQFRIAVVAKVNYGEADSDTIRFERDARGGLKKVRLQTNRSAMKSREPLKHGTISARPAGAPIRVALSFASLLAIQGLS